MRTLYRIEEIKQHLELEQQIEEQMKLEWQQVEDGIRTRYGRVSERLIEARASLEEARRANLKKQRSS